MSESRFHCFKCPERHFSNLLEAVKHVVSEAEGKGSKVRCCVEGCRKSVRKSKLRLHIRKSHSWLCPVPCMDCEAKFVEQRDLDNHRRNGCPRRKQTEIMIAAAVSSGTFWKRYTKSIGKHKLNLATREILQSIRLGAQRSVVLMEQDLRTAPYVYR